jgi:hypothetical protein
VCVLCPPPIREEIYLHREMMQLKLSIIPSGTREDPLKIGEWASGEHRWRDVAGVIQAVL